MYHPRVTIIINLRRLPQKTGLIKLNSPKHVNSKVVGGKKGSFSTEDPVKEGEILRFRVRPSTGEIRRVCTKRCRYWDVRVVYLGQDGLWRPDLLFPSSRDD